MIKINSQLSISGSSIYSLDIHPTSNHIICGGPLAGLFVIDISTTPPMIVYEKGSIGIIDLKISGDGKYLAACQYNVPNTVNIYDISNITNPILLASKSLTNATTVVFHESLPYILVAAVNGIYCYDYNLNNVASYLNPPIQSGFTNQNLSLNGNNAYFASGNVNYYARIDFTNPLSFTVQNSNSFSDNSYGAYFGFDSKGNVFAVGLNGSKVLSENYNLTQRYATVDLGLGTNTPSSTYPGKLDFITDNYFLAGLKTLYLISFVNGNYSIISSVPSQYGGIYLTYRNANYFGFIDNRVLFSATYQIPAIVNGGLTPSQVGAVSLINMHRPVSLLGNYKS